MTPAARRAPTGRADLLRALVAHGERGLRSAAELLGYVEVGAPPSRARPAAEPVDLPELDDVSSEATPRSVPSSSPTPTSIAYTDIPFWRAVAFERAEDHEPDTERWEPLTRDDLRRDPGEGPPECPPLVEWPVLWRVLDDRLRTDRESRTIDVDRLTRLWSRGRTPRCLPFERYLRLGRVTLVIDRDRRLAPFWDDQEALCDELDRRLAPTDWRVTMAPPEMIAVDRFDENDIVVVLGDLGFYDLPLDPDAAAPWLALAQRLRPTGARLWALVPCPPGRWHRPTVQAWAATDWSLPHRPPELAGSAAGDGAVAQMMRLLAMAVRIEPGLVRQLRALVPESDCGTEVDLQRHDDLRTASSSAWQFDGTAVQDWRRQLAGLSMELRRSAAEVVARWHRHLSPEIHLQLAEILRDVGVGGDLLPTGEERHLKIVEGVAATAEGATDDARVASAVESWLPRVADQLPASSWRGRLAGPLVRAYRAYREKHPEAELPPGVTTEMLAGTPSDLPITRWDVRQIGDRLRIEPANSWGEGSYVATISVQEPTIWLWTGYRTPERIEADEGIDVSADAGESLRLLSDVEAVVLEPTPAPAWAASAGRDRYGLWASFEVRGVEQRMRWIPPGRFWMGSPDDEEGRFDSEGPRHLVTLTEGFWMAETPCVQALWVAMMGENPSRFKGGQRPVEQVSWEDVQTFLDRLSFQVRDLDAVLPTEAEWEYACRAGTETATWLGGNTAEVLGQIAIYSLSSGGTTREVGGRVTNPWGLGDTLGNVWEWCWDWSGKYSTDAAFDPEGSGIGASRVLRGGSLLSYAQYVRAAYRVGRSPGLRHSDCGFRLSSGPGERGAPGGEFVDAAPRAARRGTSRRARSRRSRAWVDRLDWAVDGGTDEFGRWAAFEVEGVVHRLRWIYPGHFEMGSPATEAGRSVDESPRHVVELTEGFWLGEVPCTQALYEAVTSENPSEFQSAERPVEHVSWDDCHRFFEQLSTKVSGFSGRLPTEAQWEYACRAGTDTATWLGDLEILGANNAPLLDEIAWYGGNSGAGFDLDDGIDSSSWPEKQYPHDRAGSRRVAQKRPNPWGLYDMLGNVYEMCQDFWHERISDQNGDRQIDPGLSLAIEPSRSSQRPRVVRGGAWDSNAQHLRAADRYWHMATDVGALDLRGPSMGEGNVMWDRGRSPSCGFRISSGPRWRMPE